MSQISPLMREVRGTSRLVQEKDRNATGTQCTDGDQKSILEGKTHCTLRQVGYNIRRPHGVAELLSKTGI